MADCKRTMSVPCSLGKLVCFDFVLGNIENLGKTKLFPSGAHIKCIICVYYWQILTLTLISARLNEFQIGLCTCKFLSCTTKIFLKTVILYRPTYNLTV